MDYNYKGIKTNYYLVYEKTKNGLLLDFIARPCEFYLSSYTEGKGKNQYKAPYLPSYTEGKGKKWSLARHMNGKHICFSLKGAPRLLYAFSYEE